MVLQWMRQGYNIYIDLDFARHGSDNDWTRLMSRTLSNSNCRLTICFKSVHYMYSYAALLELLTMRSTRVTRRHFGVELSIDSLALESVPADNDIPADEGMQSLYAESFAQMKRVMGGEFAGKNAMERKLLYDGLSEWIDTMDDAVKSRLRYTRCSADDLMQDIDDTYAEGMTLFFPYIAELMKNWFDSQNINGNDIPLTADMGIRFEQSGVVRQIGRAVSSDGKTPVEEVPTHETSSGGDKTPDEGKRGKETSEGKAETKPLRRQKSVTGDITYTLYGATYTDNQSGMMYRVFREVLKRHPEQIAGLPQQRGMNCASTINYAGPICRVISERVNIWSSQAGRECASEPATTGPASAKKWNGSLQFAESRPMYWYSKVLGGAAQDRRRSDQSLGSR